MSALARRLYGGLLRALPVRLRVRHDLEMQELYEEELRYAARLGVVRWGYAVLRGLADLVEHVVLGG